jgi:hypothetical protein
MMVGFGRVGSNPMYFLGCTFRGASWPAGGSDRNESLSTTRPCGAGSNTLTTGTDVQQGRLDRSQASPS